MKYKKIISITFLVVLVLLIGTGILMTIRVKTQLKEIFKMNEALKSEGYYLSGFEFKMLAQAYYLDHGQFIKALSDIGKIHRQLTKKESLIKIPEFSGNKEKLEFYHQSAKSCYRRLY